MIYFGKYNIKSILFNINLNKDFIKILMNNKDKLYNIIGQISYNTWFGLSFVINDIKMSNSINLS